MWNVIAKIVLIRIRKKTMIIIMTHISVSTIKVISDLSSNKSHIIFSFILQDKLLHYICRTIAPIYLNNRLLTTESARARKNIIQTMYVITVHVIWNKSRKYRIHNYIRNCGRAQKRPRPQESGLHLWLNNNSISYDI